MNKSAPAQHDCPGMLAATQGSAREGRDDGVKMAARLRLLPLGAQKIIKERMKNKSDIGLEKSRAF